MCQIVTTFSAARTGLVTAKLSPTPYSAAVAHVEALLGPLAPDAALVTVADAHSATLSWLGSVAGHRIYPLGVDGFGQSGDIPDLYRAYGIDTDSVLDAAARACVRRAMSG